MSIAMAAETKPHRIESDNLILEELQDELMIYDPQRNKAFCLNQTAAFVWRHADGETTVSEIATRMEQELQKPANEQMVWFALDVLSKDGLLKTTVDLPTAPSGVTRRQVLQKMGVGAMALPVVTVLFVSPAKAHASSLSPVKQPTDPTSPPSGYNPSTDPAKNNKGFWSWVESLF